MPQRVLVATGRFQRIHSGSDRYLRTAQYLAQALRAQFFITTGPLDDELPTHGERVSGSLKRRLLTFSERQLLLSSHLQIPEQAIVPQQLSPHHDKRSIYLWAHGFFASLVERNTIDPSDLAHAGGRQVILFVATKDDDYRDYFGTGASIHYSDVVCYANPGIDVVDYTRLAGSTEVSLLTASKIDSSQLVPVMQVAESLIEHRGCRNLREYSPLIGLAGTTFLSSACTERQIKDFLERNI